MVTILDIETVGRDLMIADGRARTVLQDIIGNWVKVEVTAYDDSTCVLEGKVDGFGGSILGDVRIKTAKGVRVVNVFSRRTKILEIE